MDLQGMGASLLLEHGLNVGRTSWIFAVGASLLLELGLTHGRCNKVVKTSWILNAWAQASPRAWTDARVMVTKMKIK
jgi:hypothetical protein